MSMDFFTHDNSFYLHSNIINSENKRSIIEKTYIGEGTKWYMVEVNVNGIKVDLDYASTEVKKYVLKLEYIDEETEDGKVKFVQRGMFSLLEDYDEEDIELEVLSKSMKRKVREGGNLSPSSRQDLTNGLVKLAVEELVEEIEPEGQIEEVVRMEIEERVGVRETSFTEDYTRNK